MMVNFVVQCSAHKFSLMGKDQSHEQTDKTLQANGGISHLYDNPDAMALHMLSAPESAHIISEFEDVLSSRDQSTAHHEEAYREDPQTCEITYHCPSREGKSFLGQKP